MRKFRLIYRLFNLVSKFKKSILFAVFAGIVGNFLSISISFLAGLCIVKYLGMNIEVNYTMLFILMVIAGVLRGFLRYFEQYFNHYIAFNILAHVRHVIFVKLRELSPAKLLKKNKGDIINQITSDVETLEVFYAHTISPVLIAFFVNGLIGILLSLLVNVYLGLFILLNYLFVGVIIPVIFYHFTKKDGQKYRKSLADLSSEYLDDLKGKNDIVFNQQTTLFKESIMKRTTTLQGYKKRNLIKLEFVRSIINLVIFISGALLIYFGYILFKYQGLDMKWLVLVLSIYLASFGPIVSLASLPSNLSQTFSSANRLFDLLDESPIIKEKIDGKDFEFENLSIVNLNFKYEDKYILKNFNLVLQKKEIVGIVGPSGVGKSTLLNLLMRFYPYEGSILYNGIELNDINQSSLLENVTMFSQNTYLFNDTIRNNILIANDKANDDEIKEALKKASCLEFVESLEDGLDTVITEDSSNISLGQKQRLGLARIFIRKPKLLLLDEPTSNIDSINENVILKSLKKYQNDMTILMISHKKSSLSIATRIVNLKESDI